MKLKGKTGKGLHFPARYKPKRETKAKGAAKGVKGKTGKAVKRDDDKGEDEEVEEDSLNFLETRDEDEQEEWVNLALEAREVEEEHLNILEARRGRGGGSRGSRTRPKPARKPRPAQKRPAKPTKKPTKKPSKKPTCTPAQKKANGGKCPAKATCTTAEKKKNGGKCPAKCPNSKPVKPGKGVYMFPLLTKGVWKCEFPLSLFIIVLTLIRTQLV
ncbi:hypothetical protein BU23DRAFT_554175 [Bimuria novae-zelandiae CBS 107.79]|uniref:Uncharacterized protein n=1 Tax=Bimuria novae-zelandiae CBS 107.79 TaxID=1447943 RepID=A0A6A5VEU8_9PLEO|nr:hypothetical protein BU23DRAFT_554175 [Bimuria novae-zelandiae CBS 107.79]